MANETEDLMFLVRVRSRLTPVIQRRFALLPRLVRWLALFIWAHFWAIACLFFIVRIIFNPVSVPKIKSSANSSPSTTLPSDRQSIAAQSSDSSAPSTQLPADKAFQDPNASDADPKLSALAQLNAEELKVLGIQVDQITPWVADEHELFDRYQKLMGRIANQQLIGSFWGKTKYNDYNDKQLPYQWYEVSKARISGAGVPEELANMLINETGRNVILSRTMMIRFRIIGGKLTIGDVMFVHATQDLLIRQIKELNEANDELAPLLDRITTEFPNYSQP